MKAKTAPVVGKKTPIKQSASKAPDTSTQKVVAAKPASGKDETPVVPAKPIAVAPVAAAKGMDKPAVATPGGASAELQAKTLELEAKLKKGIEKLQTSASDLKSKLQDAEETLSKQKAENERLKQDIEKRDQEMAAKIKALSQKLESAGKDIQKGLDVVAAADKPDAEKSFAKGGPAARPVSKKG